MQIKKLLSEDDAVSPVIGVILMVAITVILAAVIASFVLGLGDSASEVQPSSSFSLDEVTDDPAESVTITLTDGDTIDEEEIVFRGSAISGGEQALDGISGDGVSDDEWSVGESVTLDDTDLDGDGNLNIVWEESGGDSSATLASYDIEY